MWYTLKAARAVRAKRLRAVQIVLPDELSPFGDRSWQPDLSNPTASV
jgi:hypothetical protein